MHTAIFWLENLQQNAVANPVNFHNFWAENIVGSPRILQGGGLKS